MRSVALSLMLLASFAGTRSSAHVAADDSAAETEIRARTEEVRVANLTGDVAVLKRLYTRDFLLTSQSGKRYLIEDAIADSAKGFESYVNSDIMVRIHGDAAIVNFVNDRKRKNVSEPGRFRVTAVWTRTKEGWRMASLQSTKISP